jgi:pyruvate dehydrogenase E2 component (dihydrolipoamide acetyltransferase)
MPIEVTMPRLSDTMEVGTIVKWNVAPGQKIKAGDVVADIETDKATMELQSFDDGTIESLVVPEGKSVKVGTVIMTIAAEGQERPAGSASRPSQPAQAPAQRADAVSGSFRGGNGRSATGTLDDAPPRDRVFASPLARKIAAERGVDLATVEGTGPSGRIVRKDVEAAAPPLRAADSARAAKLTAAHVPPTPEAMVPPPGAMLTARTVPLSTMRRIIAKRLVESKTTIPHYQVTVEADMDALLDLRRQLNEQLAPQGVKLSVNDFLVRACALAMHQHPFVNSRWVEGEGGPSIQIVGEVNIGVAVALPEERGGGLVVATIRNADRLGLRQISQLSRAMADKARAKGLSPEEMADSTFTISNLGMFAVEHFTAIINPPNVAILAVGTAARKPVVREGGLAVSHRMAMTMSSDHRVVDGAMAAQYLATVRQMLERPATLLV